MFDALSGGDQREVGGELVFIFAFLDGFLAFFDDALHGFAGFGFGRAAQELSCGAQTLNVAFGLLKMLVERFLEFGFVGGLGHLGKSGNELIFCAEQIAQLFLDNKFLSADCFSGHVQILLVGTLISRLAERRFRNRYSLRNIVVVQARTLGGYGIGENGRVYGC